MAVSSVQITRSLSMDRGTQRPTSPEKEVRIVVLGASGVGKSALVVRYLTRRFIGEYAHKELFSIRHTMMEGKPARLHILDTTAEGDDNDQLVDHIQWGDGFLLVFSITDLASFYNITSIMDSISSARQGRTTPCVLIANKVDLCHVARKISEIQGRRLAARLNCPYIETSARESYCSVVQAFSALFHEIKLNQKKERLQKMAKKSNSTISQLRETLRSLTDFRNRTHTF